MSIIKQPLGVEVCEPVGARIVHATLGRVRLWHEALVFDQRAALHVEKTLRRAPGVISIRTNSRTGSTLIYFETPSTAETLLALLEAAIQSLEAMPKSEVLAIAPECSPNEGAPFYVLPIETVASVLETRLIDGLTPEQAAARLAKWGPNELPRARQRSAAMIFAEQLTSLPIALLAASAALSVATGGIADAVMIAAVVFVNAGIATATEREADRTILSLMEEGPQSATVIRDGMKIVINVSEVTIGDILIIDRGGLVPADARLIESSDLSINESPLTGEAHPAKKDAREVLLIDALISDRRNMVFRGTSVTSGSGVAIVTAVGASTEMGRIQELLGAVRPPETPIQRELGEVGRELVIINGAICATVFALGLMRGHPFIQTLRSAISLAVAAIPEGLPAVATTTLAIGIQDMRKRQVFVRKIDAVETLGAVEVVGLDKTGTLTENRMAATVLHLDSSLLELNGRRLLRDGSAVENRLLEQAREFFEIATLCSDAVTTRAEEGFRLDGTPTEVALLSGGIALGVDPVDIRLSARVLLSVARGDGRKRMSTLHETPEGLRLLCVKGDPLEVLDRCSMRQTTSGVVLMDETGFDEILKANARMAGDALRVLGVAYRRGDGDPHDEKDLTWIGLVGMANPVRASVRPAIKQLHRAGVRTVMITGDQSATAEAIARNLDLHDGKDLCVLEAGQIANMRPELLTALAGQPHVFARVSPVDKLNIVKALQANGRIVAMTGDGVNDGPALRAADIGIAMGGEGADVARQVADIVLASDDMDGIVEAIRLGRATYANIRKVLRYLVATNASETFVMLGAALTNAGEPLTPMQLLWLNLATDALPALALGLEPPEADVLDQPPHNPAAPIMGANDFKRVLREGSVMGTTALLGYYSVGGLAGSPRASTIIFHALTFSQLLHAIACRSETHGLSAEFGRRPNPQLFGGIAVSVFMQMLAQYLPPTRRLLGLTPLIPADVIRIAAVAIGSSLVNDVVGRAADHISVQGAVWHSDGETHVL